MRESCEGYHSVEDKLRESFEVVDGQIVPSDVVDKKIVGMGEVLSEVGDMIEDDLVAVRVVVLVGGRVVRS
jgi:hypothetical protein